MTLESHLEQTVTSASNVSRICESTADPMLPLPPKDRIWNRRISTKGLGILPQDQMNVHVILNHWLILHIAVENERRNLISFWLLRKSDSWRNDENHKKLFQVQHHVQEIEEGNPHFTIKFNCLHHLTACITLSQNFNRIVSGEYSTRKTAW